MKQVLNVGGNVAATIRMAIELTVKGFTEEEGMVCDITLHGASCFTISLQ